MNRSASSSRLRPQPSFPGPRSCNRRLDGSLRLHLFQHHRSTSPQVDTSRPATPRLPLDHGRFQGGGRAHHAADRADLPHTGDSWSGPRPCFRPDCNGGSWPIAGSSMSSSWSGGYGTAGATASAPRGPLTHTAREGSAYSNWARGPSVATSGVAPKIRLCLVPDAPLAGHADENGGDPVGIDGDPGSAAP